MKQRIPARHFSVLTMAAVAVAITVVSTPRTKADTGAVAPQSKGTVEKIKVHGKSLEGNLEGDSPDRDVSLYLPPSYEKDRTRRYPVVYLLHGFTDSDDRWFSSKPHFTGTLPTSLNSCRYGITGILPSS